MKLHGMNLPAPENIIEAVRIARNIHAEQVEKNKRIMVSYRWNEYWVQVYDNVLKVLEKNLQKP